MIIGGVPASQEWADEIGADGYAENATEAVQVVKRLVGLADVEQLGDGHVMIPLVQRQQLEPGAVELFVFARHGWVRLLSGRCDFFECS